jgi:hypothetical protein
MLNHSLKNLAFGAALALTAGGVWAQTATTPSTPATNIGVAPQDAREATQKAVPQADTGTLVRTEPSAVTRAQEAARDVNNPATSNTRTTSPAANTTSTANTGVGSNANSSGSTSASDSNTLASGTGNRTTRPLRADRN